jgi:hypothetical protein
LNGKPHGTIAAGTVARAEIEGAVQAEVEASAEGIPALKPESRTLNIRPGESLQTRLEFAPALRDLRMRVDMLLQEGDQHRTSGDDLPAALRAYRQAQRISPDADKRQEAGDKESKVAHECRLENIPCGD